MNLIQIWKLSPNLGIKTDRLISKVRRYNIPKEVGAIMTEHQQVYTTYT
jgi:hypothetical protein